MGEENAVLKSYRMKQINKGTEAKQVTLKI